MYSSSCLGAICILIIFNFSVVSIRLHAISTKAKSFHHVSLQLDHVDRSQSEMIFILVWPVKSVSPFNLLGTGSDSFVKNKCKYKNCFVSNNRKYFIGKYNRNFDAVVFNGPLLLNFKPNITTKHRLPNQKYIFGMMESPIYYPLCNKDLDGFFNWTWTYKLDSDFRWGYITIYNKNGTFVGPKTDMHWIKNMDPIDGKLKYKLSRKTKAAAWFVSNCHSKNGRENFNKEVQRELKAYGLSVNVVGKCGPYKCPRGNSKHCNKRIEDEYYFYFSFENSFAEDYVTEKLLTALNNYAVPVVFGGANYSRFLPEGSYLDGRKLGPKNLAKTMNEVIKNKTKYYDYFRWRNHYIYKETSYDVDLCNLCAMLNNDKKVKQKSTWKNFRSWWNGNKYEQNCNSNKNIIKIRSNTRL